MTRVALFLLALTTLSGPAVADSVQAFQLPANDLVYDSGRNRIYASTPASAATGGNTVAVIDPESGQVVTRIPVGSDPGRLALSDDGGYLYVALRGASFVDRVRLETGQVDLHIPLGSRTGVGALIARDIQVAPNHPQELLACLASSDGNLSAGVALFDNDQQRPMSINTITDQAVFSSTAGRLYGFDTTDSRGQFQRIDETSSGIRVMDTLDDAFGGYHTDPIYSHGLIYASLGQVIDPEARTLVGTLHVSGGSSLECVFPDPQTGRIYGVTNDLGGGLHVYAFDIHTLAAVGSFALPPSPSFPRSLIRCGTDCLAFLTDYDGFYLVHGSLVPPALPATDLRLSVTGPTSAVAGQPAVYTLTARNNGVSTAPDARVSLTVADGVVVQAVNASGGTGIATSHSAFVTWPQLAPGQTATATLTLVGTIPGLVGFEGVLDSSAPEPSMGDNRILLTLQVAAADGPELVGSWQSAQVVSSGRNRLSLRGALSVFNGGNRPAKASKVRIYVSSDGRFDAGDTLLKELAVPALAPRALRQVNVNVPLRMGLSGKFIIAILDARNSVAESVEQDNVIYTGPLP